MSTPYLKVSVEVSPSGYYSDAFKFEKLIQTSDLGGMVGVVHSIDVFLNESLAKLQTDPSLIQILKQLQQQTEEKQQENMQDEKEKTACQE